MKKYVPLVLLLQFLFITDKVLADEGIQCPQAKVQAANGQTLIFKEYEFEHGVHDLVITNTEKSEIKRVTYSGKANLNKPREQSCVYKALAIIEGEGWGWHLAWTFNEKTGVFYSRMDGVAWVSTPARRIEEGTADMLKFELKGEQVILNGYTHQSGESAAFELNSNDEGRNW